MKKNRSSLFNSTNEDSRSQTTISMLNNSNYSTRREVSAYEYAKLLEYTEGSLMIEKKSSEPSTAERYVD